MLASPSIAVVFPAFNEELTIEGTIRDFYYELPEALFVVVDNNSTDNTAIIAKETLEDLGVKGTILSESEQGKGNAVRKAFKCVHADVYVLVDADMTYPARHVHDLIEPVLNDKADMVVGDRHCHGRYRAENKRSFHNFGNGLVKFLVNKLFNAGLSDVMSGYRAFSRRFVKNYPVLVEGFQIEVDLTLHALDKRFRVSEIPIEYQDRPSGSFSKLSTFSDGFSVLFAIMQILRYYRPLFFFGVLSFFLAVISIVAGIPVISDWVRDQYIHHVPLAILASALGILSFLSLTLGLILDSVIHQFKLKYELDLLREKD